MNKTVSIDCGRIIGWPTFHDAFSEAFGFPESYGRNLDAWVDCMTRLDEDFSSVRVGKNEVVTLQLINATKLKVRKPELLDAIFEMTAFVNFRRIEQNEKPIILVSCCV